MDAKLYVSVKSSPNVEDVVYYIDKNVMNQNFDAGDTDPKTEFNETYDTIDNFYWIDVEEALEKYSDVYGPLAVI